MTCNDVDGEAAFDMSAKQINADSKGTERTQPVS